MKFQKGPKLLEQGLQVTFRILKESTKTILLIGIFTLLLKEGKIEKLKDFGQTKLKESINIFNLANHPKDYEKLELPKGIPFDIRMKKDKTIIFELPSWGNMLQQGLKFTQSYSKPQKEAQRQRRQRRQESESVDPITIEWMQKRKTDPIDTDENDDEFDMNDLEEILKEFRLDKKTKKKT